MSLINFFRKLSGLIEGGEVIEPPVSELTPEIETKELREAMPAGDRIRKKQDWISAKRGKF